MGRRAVGGGGGVGRFFSPWVALEGGERLLVFGFESFEIWTDHAGNSLV